MAFVVGVGLDLIDLAHFRIHYGDGDTDLLARCFTPQELASIGDGVDRLAKMAARFAAKEATFKALGGGEQVAHLDIEIVPGTSGAPQIKLHRAAKDIADEHRVTSLIVSLTHSAASAAAVVIVLSKPLDQKF